ncbi:MAG TPA: radical SAM family heme chaperone HemW, partial [Phycisphaerales bacterium]|nr:radical SAM family heme chaperone HemW [Phycisphaerales bacterium]
MPLQSQNFVQLSHSRDSDFVDSPPGSCDASPQRTVKDLPLSPNAIIHGLYFHVPFCFHKCHYCDFYSIVDSQNRQPAFINRIIRELEAISPRLRSPLQSIFIGGGTPTLLEPPLLHELLIAIQSLIPAQTSACPLEFTVEANPETVTTEIAEILKSGGVNRVSIGCQSFNPAHLKTLERWHDPASVPRAVSHLRKAGIHNINLDLIFAIPGQLLDDWLADLDAALSLQPDHISCYGLTYEPNTPLTMKMKSGTIIPAENDLEAAMYEAAIDRLAAAGFHHYEISNWARAQQS